MPTEEPMHVVLCWHMHQPDYRNHRSGIIHAPWTYLHATKDYLDMAALLEQEPGARAVVNFSPILLEQIEDYCGQIEGFLSAHGAIRDPILAALVEPALPGSPRARLRLMQDCLRANRERMIGRFPAYQRLTVMADWYLQHPDSMIYASNQFLADLLVWYHLSWLGENARQSDPRVQELQDKESGYSLHDRRELLKIIHELMQSLLPRYRSLADRGQVELSMSPYAHPILPLLIDPASALEAMPEATLPLTTDYPQGEVRARWHIRHGQEVFQRVFGRPAEGLWPSEGGISERTLQLAGEEGMRWIASGGCVLENSTHEAEDSSYRHRVYEFGGAPVACLFRDDGLSDLIGFTYSDWRADDAVADLVGHMENIAAVCPDRKDCVTTVLLDGENAWEHYPENGWLFLSQLYAALVDHPKLALTTFSEFLGQCHPSRCQGAGLVAGSWVYGTFSTWIGDQDKNRAWELLIAAKQVFDTEVESGRLQDEDLREAERQLAICEGSDWFWWFGDYNPAESVSAFDQLFRIHLANLYDILNVEAPSALAESISTGRGQPARGGVMRRHREEPDHG